MRPCRVHSFRFSYRYPIYQRDSKRRGEHIDWPHVYEFYPSQVRLGNEQIR